MATALSGAERRVYARLAALSFLALFLELMMIRWVPAVVRLVAYYANLMLISSFLGLGIGSMLGTRRLRLFGAFPFILALDVAFLLACRQVVLGGGPEEKRFFTEHVQSINYWALIGIFAFNAAVFVPLGQEIGALFQRLTTLRAYRWDLAGALAGTVCFGLFSLWWFSPLLGLTVMAGVYLVLCTGRQRIWSAPALALVVTTVASAGEQGALWSPYHHVTVIDFARGPVSEPVERLRSMRDPPVYEVRVNQDFYQHHGTIDRARYSEGPRRREMLAFLHDMYFLPYALAEGRGRAAVLGAGGGIDVEAALLSGVEQVDAVEIDPVLLELSRRFNASGIYDDPRVDIHLADARAFLRTAEPGYDLVVFGFLDSQALFSSMSNIRLDGFVYTVESFRSAFDLLDEDGVLVVSFAATYEWLARKLQGMLVRATGREPVVYRRGLHVVLGVRRGGGGESPEMPARFGRFERIELGGAEHRELATDDWPYLYLRGKTIPSDYLAVIGTLLAASLISVASLRRTTFGFEDAHFLFLGMGFLLLQTKSIGDCSLYFGSTWLVTTLVVTGVLLMALAANEVAIRLRRFSPLLYLPLLLSLIVLVLVDRQSILSLPLAGRLAWTVLFVPLPVFFAGLIFSTTFRKSSVPAALFGANLIGAMVGGFGEYLGMAMGTKSLSLLVIGAYTASFLCQRARRVR